ncbi:MAG: TetR family transcriptional regulator [Nocardioides sp.]|nr:TetR family transcriptional regulator [Nocardioides sp.]
MTQPVDTGTRQERKERTRQAILDAALTLAAEETLAAVSLRQVTREVGIVPTAFYRHFASVEELGLALVDESFASLRGMIRSVRAGNPSLEDVVRDSASILVEHVHQHRDHFRFIARERFGGMAEVRIAIAHELDLFERELAADVARLPGMEAWSAEDLRILANLIINAMVATAESLLDADGRAAERLAEHVARRQLTMIIVGAANWRSSP